MRLSKSAAIWILLACPLTAVVFVAIARSGTTGGAAVPAIRLFVANPGSGTVSVYPVGKFGNVPSLVTYPNLASPSGIARDAAGRIYVANSGSDAITVYAAGASGTPNPVATIAGSKTGLKSPVGIAVDSKGNIYVANGGRGSRRGTDGSVTVYPPRSNGNVKPSAVITGTKTGLIQPAGIALDSNGNIYVINNGVYVIGNVTVYRAGSNGNVAPVTTLAGSSTGLSTPAGIAVDSSHNIYVTNDDYGRGGDAGGTVEMFRSGSTGNVAPATKIYGSCSGLNTPQGVAVDPAGNIYVANNGQRSADPSPSIAVYAAGSSGCAMPTMICGAATGLSQPAGLTLDSKLNIYVTDSYADGIAVFAPMKPQRDLDRRPLPGPTPPFQPKGTFGARGGFLGTFSPTSGGCAPATGSGGNIAPIEAISNPDSGIDNPFGIAFDKSGNIYVANAGSQDGGFDSVTVYPAGSNANVSPTATIGAGSAIDKTGLNDPDAIAVDSEGEIYVANALGGASRNGTITVYSSGSNGNVLPVHTIGGASTGLNDPAGLAIDSAGYLYVLNTAGGPNDAGSVTIFAPGSGGNVAPVRTISGDSNADQTGFYYPSGLARDSNNNIYVTNDGSASGGADSVTIYAAGSTGNVAPMATISGPLTQLNMPSGIAVDSSGNIYVANQDTAAAGSSRTRNPGGKLDSITVYPPGSHGNVAPAMRMSNGTILRGAIINGRLTGLSMPAGLALFPGS